VNHRNDIGTSGEFVSEASEIDRRSPLVADSVNPRGVLFGDIAVFLPELPRLDSDDIIVGPQNAGHRSLDAHPPVTVDQDGNGVSSKRSSDATLARCMCVFEFGAPVRYHRAGQRITDFVR
jgi:hypothetical protein